MEPSQNIDPSSRDSPKKRQRRMQQRIKEISDRGEQELATIVKSIDLIKRKFNPQNRAKPTNENPASRENNKKN